MQGEQNVFQLNEGQLRVQETARAIAQTVIRENAARIDAQESFPHENIRALAESGILGCPYEPVYGGSGEGFLAYVLAIEEVAKICGATASIIATHGVSMYCLHRYGTEEQKAHYMPRMIGGELMGFALTEADAGSDANNMTTFARREGDHFVLNGAKMFISSAPANRFHIVIAVTGTDERGKKQYTAFVVDRETEGVSVGKPIRKLGIRGSLTAELILEDCVVPASQILGKEGEGMRIALSSLDAGRICMGTQALGIAQGALEQTVAFVQDELAQGRTLDSLQNAQFTLAELQTRVDAGRLLLWRAADRKDQGLSFSKEAAMGKLYNSDLAMETTAKCMDFLGDEGYCCRYPVERMMRDAKITQIYEGANEIQKMVIGRAIGIK